MMERCASVLAFEHLPEGKATVGFEVCIKHVAAAGEGAACTVHGRLARWSTSASCASTSRCSEGERTIGVGTHERRVRRAGPAFGGWHLESRR